MLSITECKKILNKKGVQFNEEEIKTIRNVLYKLAEVCHKNINNKY
jgi:DNA-directed RNA polymerase subunit F